MCFETSRAARARGGSSRFWTAGESASREAGPGSALGGRGAAPRGAEAFMPRRQCQAMLGGARPGSEGGPTFVEGRREDLQLISSRLTKSYLAPLRSAARLGTPFASRAQGAGVGRVHPSRRRPEGGRDPNTVHPSRG